MSSGHGSVEGALLELIRTAVRQEVLALQEEGVLASGGPVPLLYNITDAAPLLGVSTPTLYRLIRKGLPTVRVGATRRVVLAEALDWLRAGGAYDGDEKEG